MRQLISPDAAAPERWLVLCESVAIAEITCTAQTKTRLVCALSS
jgi:hypothetical protein